jgi:hypothetical protein
VRETCIHAVPVKRSQFPLSKVPSFQDTRKKKGAVPVQKHRGSRRHCAGKLGGAFWEYFSFQEPALVIQIPDSTPRPGFWRTGQFPKTGSGHPESRFRASPRILEPGQISRSRYRHAESRLRASPCDLEIERQNTDSKFRDSSFCLRSCTHASPALGCARV